jgi:hypothetical protein
MIEGILSIIAIIKHEIGFVIKQFSVFVLLNM